MARGTVRRTGDFTIVAEGLNDFRRDLRKVGAKEFPKQIAAANKHLSKKLAAAAQTRAQAVWAGNPSARIARAISGSGTTKAAGIAISKARDPRVFAAEFGTHLHTVFGRRRLASRMKRRVFPSWTGNQWSTQGDGPKRGVGTAVQPVLRERKEWTRDKYFDYLEIAFKREAFPD